MPNPELDDFDSRTRRLASHPLLRGTMNGDEVALKDLSLESISQLIKDDAAYYFLLTASGLNRTSLKKAIKAPEALIVTESLRRAYAIKKRLPFVVSFSATRQKSVASRRRDFQRRERATAEALLKERMKAEEIPLCMAPPIRRVPAILISRRKPDGVYPDPSTGRPPLLYLEIKNIRRVSDDIQKRLYEIAETALEMKTLYGDLQLVGQQVSDTAQVDTDPSIRKRIRAQLTASPPTVVAFFICAKAEAEKYRSGAETFIDRVFFQEEVDACIDFIRRRINEFESGQR